jgi:hypothetical protein
MGFQAASAAPRRCRSVNTSLRHPSPSSHLPCGGAAWPWHPPTMHIGASSWLPGYVWLSASARRTRQTHPSRTCGAPLSSCPCVWSLSPILLRGMATSRVRQQRTRHSMRSAHPLPQSTIHLQTPTPTALVPTAPSRGDRGGDIAHAQSRAVLLYSPSSPVYDGWHRPLIPAHSLCLAPPCPRVTERCTCRDVGCLRRRGLICTPRCQIPSPSLLHAMPCQQCSATRLTPPS